MAEATAELIGGIEAGGTKFVCAVADPSTGRVIDRTSIHDPAFSTGNGENGRDAVLGNVVEWLRSSPGRLAAVGIGSFGPLDLRTGTITTTPKPGWQGFPLRQHVQNAFPSARIVLDTDVNAAARGEQRWGRGQGCSDFLYITLGTGIGAGAVIAHELLHGLLHPEMGHLRVPRIPGDPFPGICARHGDCWEGLCSGPAIEARAGRRAGDIPAGDAAWTYAIRYNAYAIANLICVLSPQKVIVGGSGRKAGGLGEEAFFHRLRAEVRAALAGYIAAPELGEGIGDYIVPPGLGDDAGVCGAVALAMDALRAPTTTASSTPPARKPASGGRAWHPCW